MEDKRFLQNGIVYDDNNAVVSPISDDYEYWKTEQDNITNPMSDDYCKYNNE